LVAAVAEEAERKKAKDNSLRLRPLRLLNKLCIRAYQLKDDRQCDARALDLVEIFQHFKGEETRPFEVETLEDCDEYVEKLGEIRRECQRRGLVPLYHYTAPFVGPLVLEGGFRMSTQGQGDGGVYFSTVGPAGYGLGTNDYERNIIIDCFGKERVDEYLGKGNLDVCLVYGCHPRVLIQAPGGRDNAKMVPKITFSDFAKPNRNGDYFLRPDKIFGAFQLGPTHLPRATEGSRLGMATEKQNDAEVKWSLAVSEQELKCNDLRNHPDSVAGLNPLPHVVEQLSYNEKMRSAIERLAEKAKGTAF